VESAAIEHSLEASRIEGVAAQVTGGILDCFLVPFALQLGAGTQEIGWLVSVPSLLSAVSQFFVVAVLKAAGCRRRFLIGGAALQGLALLPLAALALAPVQGRLRLVLAFVVAFRVLSGVMGPAWGSLMSEYLPEDRRGRYFGGRSQLIGLWGLLSTAFWGVYLYMVKPISAPWAFCGLFMAAAGSRLWSCRYMARMACVPEAPAPEEPVELPALLRRARGSNFARYALYLAAFTFATQLSASFFSVHMLRDLRFGYLSYMSVVLASAVASFLSYPAWGRHADRLGNARILRLNAFLIPLLPLLWLLSEKPALLTVIELFSGFVWAGFNLCSANFVYDAVQPSMRARALALCNLFNGAAIFAGATLGGWLAGRLPPLLGFRLHSLFLLSAGARLAAAFALSKGFREVRSVPEQPGDSELFMDVVGDLTLMRG
jgi:MFS family permease